MNRITGGQASVEFILVLGVIIAIFAVLSYLVYEMYVKSNDLKVYIFGTRLANHISDEVNTVNAVGDGHSSYFDVPGTLYGSREYTISFYRNESSVFIEGSSFTVGANLTYSSPMSTSQVHCLLPECNDVCNKSENEECLEVNGTRRIRVVKYAGKVYLTPTRNVEQGDVQFDVTPFDGSGNPDFLNPPGYVRNGGEKWNVMYIYRNLDDDSVGIAWNMNLSSGEKTTVALTEVMGDQMARNGNTDPESGENEWIWTGNTPGGYEIRGAYLLFSGGFRLCIVPNGMPSEDWTLISYDGTVNVLDKNKKVCITYP